MPVYIAGMNSENFLVIAGILCGIYLAGRMYIDLCKILRVSSW